MMYNVNHIPQDAPLNRRPELKLSPTTITIHNTGNSSSSAKGERAWLTNPTNSRVASFHIVVDEHEAIECVPLNEVAWHAGDGSAPSSGNRTSIGIEICESGNYAKTLDNAVDLVAKMLKERGWEVDHLRRHFDWSGKICPSLMYDGGKWTGWFEFKNRVAAKLAAVEDDMEKVEVYVNGKKMADGLYDDKAGITYVPVRPVANELGASVKWDGKQKRVDLTK